MFDCTALALAKISAYDPFFGGALGVVASGGSALGAALGFAVPRYGEATFGVDGEFVEFVVVRDVRILLG